MEETKNNAYADKEEVLWVRLFKFVKTLIDLSGHTPGSIAILDEKYRVLFGGDSVQAGRIYMFGTHRNMKRYIETMNELKDYVDQFDVAGFLYAK